MPAARDTDAPRLPVEPIAIIGMALRVPGAGSVDEYWRNLVDGVESIRFYSREEQEALGVSAARLDDPGFVPAAAVLDEMEYLDAGLFGMTPREAEVRDPQHRLFLELSHTALEDGGYDPFRYDGEIGVYGGSSANDYQWKNVVRNSAVLTSTGTFAMAIGNHSSYLSTFTSYKLNLRGPSLTVQTACSTSLVAIHLACEALRNRECEMALAGAASIDLPHGQGYTYADGGILSPDGHCRAFDANAGGTVWGSGGGVVLLKRLSAAVADGDPVRAVIRGNAINNDGAEKVGFAAPSVDGQAAVIAQALGIGGVDPRTVRYVEAHGTGTALGDPIEMAALTAAFRTGGDDDDTGWCALGSVKTNIGHLSAASGVAGLVKAVLALERRLIPPSLHFDRPHPKIDFDSSPFFVPTEPTLWPAGGTPPRAGVSSFGVGGTNAHLVVEEAPLVTRPAAEAGDPQARGPGPAGPQLLLVSARTPAALDAVAERLADHLSAHPNLDLGAAAFTLRQGRRAHAHRAFVVADTAADAARALTDRRRRPGGQTPARTPKVAFLFSGQGSQYAGMGAGLYEADATYRDAVDECADLLAGHLALDLRAVLLANGPARQAADGLLARTELAQPALFTVEYALARMWARWGVEPGAMVGHSVGEYVAATLAGVFTLPDALALVARRGALMQDLPAGAMLAVRLAEDAARESLPDELSVAAVNGPDTVTVAGPAAPLDAYAAVLAERGVGHVRLRASHAFHSPMMDPILAEFRDVVAGVDRRPPTRPLLSNLTGGWATGDLVTAPSYWVRHLRETVRFGDEVSTLLRDGAWTLVEVGPGRQLAGLARRCVKTSDPAPLTSLPAPEATTGDLATMLASAGRLWLSGVPVEVDRAMAPGRRVPLPTYPYERRYFWVSPTSSSEPTSLDRPAGRLPLDDWFAVPTWRQVAAPPAHRPGFGAPPGPIQRPDPGQCAVAGDEGGDGAEGERVVVIAGGGGTDPAAAALVAHLRDAGADVRLVGPGDLEWVSADGPLPGRIVHAAAWRNAPVGLDPDAAWAAQERGFFSVLRLAQALAAAQPDEPIHLDVVTDGVHGVVGDDVVSPEHATLAGAALVLPLELPWLTVRHVDAQAGSTSPSELGAELLRPPPDGVTTVALRWGRRWVRGWEAVPVAGSSPPAAGVRPGSVCLVTGGLGGLGITIAEDLAARAGARLALLSRSPLPDRSEWNRHLAVHGTTDRTGRAIAAIRRMESAGADVLVLAGDVSDVAGLRRVRAAIEGRFGRLDLIVHAAGLPGGGMAEVKEREQAEAVLAPKVRGTLALAAVFGDLPLDAVVLCASVTGFAGGFGQVDYCGANAFLDAVAHAGSAFGGRAVSVDWGSWLEVGMAAEVAAPDAFRALQRAVVGTPLAHPVLTAAYRAPASGAAWCTGTISPATHWVLDEHRLAGRAVMPGTAHVSTVVSAARAVQDLAADRLLELRDAVLVEPLVVPDDGQAELRVAFAPGAADDLEFQVTSRARGEEHVHARGTVAVVAAGPAPVHDLAAIRRRCQIRTVDGDHALSRSGLFTFGPRWSNLGHLEVGVDEEIARLEAADPVVGDLERWAVHPALLDEATALASGRMSGKFLPMGYGRLLVRAPLPGRFWSHLRYRDGATAEVVVADVTLLDDNGVELVSITEFMLRRVDVEAIRAGTFAPTAAAAPVAAAIAAPDPAGIAPGDGAEALRRILATDLGPQVAVSAVGVPAVLAAARALTQRTVADELTTAPAARPKRAAGDDAAPPATELEGALTRLWQDALGIEELGVDDDFFELGGNSLVAIQLLASIRAATGQRIPMRSLFEASSVARMAAEIDRLRAATPAAPAADDPDGAPIVPLPRSPR